jgi:4-amino-4-deoxy-L-arabinose transferase-like glycosyltransferase
MKSGITFPIKIFVVALALRLAPVLLTRSLGIGLDDMFQYDMLARSLAGGNGYRWYALEDLHMLQPYVDFDLTQVAYDPVRGVATSFRAPLYPAFLALVYLIAGMGAGRFFTARLAQAALGALLAPLTYLIARRLFPERGRADVLSAWIVACYPLLILYPIGLATENLFFTLLLASFLFLLRLVGQPSRTACLLSGIVLGLTALTRSVILPFAGLSVLWAWFALKERRGALLMALAMLIVITPWVARNSRLHGRLTGIESSMGYNLYLGYHPQGDGSFVFGPSLDLLSILDDVERDRLGTAQALTFIRADPGRVLPLALDRLGFFMGLEKRVLMYFYSNDLVGYLPAPVLLTVAAILLLPFVLVALAAVLGLGLLPLRPGPVLLLLLLVAYSLPHVLILAEDRFHLALVPFFAILAAQVWSGAWRELGERWHASRTGKVVVSLVVIAAGLLVLNWGLELTRDAGKIAALLGPNGNQTYFPY